ncbi:MAG: hypothetical protein HS108_09185 [Planctomycetes bacterium]|jgi:hypothetical protein|nr:hypothetical protein [Planctomycetota bacterium]MCL4729711.1 hypothetical protein [Planctomycetota bacterium]
MSAKLPAYSHQFGTDKELDVARLLERTTAELFVNMQGPALETAIVALERMIARHLHGDPAVSDFDTLRAARELRNLMHEKAALLRQCRAEAIELLGLRPRPPLENPADELVTAKVAAGIVAQTPADAPAEPTTATAPARPDAGPIAVFHDALEKFVKKTPGIPPAQPQPEPHRAAERTVGAQPQPAA